MDPVLRILLVMYICPITDQYSTINSSTLYKDHLSLETSFHSPLSGLHRQSLLLCCLFVMLKQVLYSYESNVSPVPNTFQTQNPRYN